MTTDKDLDGEWENTPDEVVDEMVSNFDIIKCSVCKNEYSLLNAEWTNGDCICPKCGYSTGDIVE